MQKKLIANASRSHMRTRSQIQLCGKNQTEWFTFQHLCFLKRQVGYEVLPLCTHNHKYADQDNSDQILYIYRLYRHLRILPHSFLILLFHNTIDGESLFLCAYFNFKCIANHVLTELTDEIENYKICVLMFFI